LLLLGLALLLVVGAGLALLLLHQRERRRMLQQRIEAVSAPHLRARVAQTRTITRPRVAAPQPLVRQLGCLFGCDPMASDEGLRWYLVLPATFGVSYAAGELAAGLLGDLHLTGVPVFWVMLSRSLWGWRREKRLGLLLAQFPDALAMIVRSVRVGIPVTEAVRIVAREAHEPTASSFGELASEIAIGVSLETALPQMAERSGLAEYRFFATAITLQAQTGGALSETLENLADVIRRRIALRARGHALSSEARTSGMVLAVLPIVVGVGLYLMNPGYIGLLFTDPQGRTLFGVAVVSLGVGLLSMRYITKRVLS
jgi:tight adherence protein B